MNKNHNKDYFFKYVSSDIAIKILTDLKVRWSSPLIFIDPFDTVRELKFNFKNSELKESILQEIKTMVYAEVEPICNEEHVGCQLVKNLRKNRDRIDGPIKVSIENTIEEGVQEMERRLIKHNEFWKKWLKMFRIFCVSDVADDLLMWAHYGEGHKGVVLKLRCLPERDNALCAARKVNYNSLEPSFGDIKDWTLQLTGQKKMDRGRLFLDYVFTKSPQWSYEKEWRCYSYRMDEVGKLFGDYPIFPEEIESIVFGQKIEPLKQQKILEIIKNKLTHVKVFKATKKDNLFKLNYEAI